MTDVSVVITTYNRPLPLLRCLTALTTQTSRPTQVLVVDDGSKTPVADLIPDRFWSTLPLEVIRNEPNRGPACGRNVGAAAAKGATILFLDDDVVATPDLMTRHVEARAENPHAAVIGPLVAPPDWKPTPWNLWEARELAIEYDRMKRGVYAPTWRQFFTGNASVARDDFLKAGGFDERFTRAEDIELGVRLERVGCAFVFEDRAIGWHYAHRSRASWRRIPGDYARFDRLIGQLHPDLRWTEVVEGELKGRHPLIRATRASLRPIRLERPVAAAAIAGASVLFRFGLKATGLAALSLSFSLEYAAAFEDARIRQASIPSG